ncbi:MAG TPA: hypothetical protein VGG39_20185 [Polyangiaceae bacterium]|jgi:hypothetical protein
MPLGRIVTLAFAAHLAFAAAACGVAFSSGTKPSAAPVAFSDVEHEAPPGDRFELSRAATRPVPTVGVSFVLNGTPFDAGGLPPPPIPVVVPP